MTIDMDREYERFIDNYKFNHDLALRAELPLARWAYGACEEWIKDFEGSVDKTKTMRLYRSVIERRKQILQQLKEKLKEKFHDNKTLMEMLK